MILNYTVPKINDRFADFKISWIFFKSRNLSLVPFGIQKNLQFLSRSVFYLKKFNYSIGYAQRTIPKLSLFLLSGYISHDRVSFYFY